MSRSRVSDIMTPSVTISQDASILEAVQKFEQEKISGAPVVDAAGNAVGVLSRTDVSSSRMMNLIEGGRPSSQIKVSELMNTRAPIAVNQDDPIDDAIELMDNHQIHRVFVKDSDGRIVGIVSALNVVSAMRYSFESYL